MAGIKIDGGAGPEGLELYAPDLYKADRLAVPLNGFDAVDDDAIAQYRRTGFLAIENAFSPEEVRDAQEALAHLVGGGNPDFEGVYFEQFAADRLSDLTLDEKLDSVRKLASFVDYEPRLKALSDHPKVTSLISRLLRDSGTPWMFQDMALLKPPGGREKPWHQDKAYFDVPIESPVAGIWIALDAVGPENGCMFLLEGAQALGPVVHFHRRDWQICDSDVTSMPWDVVAVPLQPGGCMVFDGLLPHGTPTNTSDKRRRACQFHYAPSGTPRSPKEDRIATFGSEGKDVSC